MSIKRELQAAYHFAHINILLLHHFEHLRCAVGLCHLLHLLKLCFHEELTVVKSMTHGIQNLWHLAFDSLLHLRITNAKHGCILVLDNGLQPLETLCKGNTFVRQGANISKPSGGKRFLIDRFHLFGKNPVIFLWRRGSGRLFFLFPRSKMFEGNLG